MPTSDDPARDARSFAREQRFALASLAGSEHEETVRIALAGDGRVLLGDDVPVVANPRKPTRLVTGVRNCFACFEGQVTPSFDTADRRRFAERHPGFELRWSVEPDLVSWHCVDRGPHAFLAHEWLVEELPDDEVLVDLMDRLNREHSEALSALVDEVAAEPGIDPRLIDVDIEGVLLETRHQMLHIPFEAISPLARDVIQALLRLVRNTRDLVTESPRFRGDPQPRRQIRSTLDLGDAPRLARVRPWS
ncbi:MAG: hypothetical protein AB8G23_15855 [Myxococcota bacterium]